MLINDLSETSPPRRRIIQQPLRTEPPIALIGGDGRTTAELEALLKRGHPLITFPSLSHFLAEPPNRGGRDAWAAIVMARPSAWDVRLSRYVARRRDIALFAQPEEGYGWPDDVSRVRELAEVDGWLARLKEPEPISIVKKSPRAPRKPRAEAPAKTPSWLEQDAPVWDALAGAGKAAAVESATEPRKPLTERPASRRPPEQLELATLGGPRASKPRASKPRTNKPRTNKPRQAESRPARSKAAAEVRGERRGRKPRTAARVETPAARPELAPERISQLTRSLLKELKPLSAREEAAFLTAAAEVGVLRASELLEELRARAASLR